MSNSDIRVVVSESNPIGVQMEYTTNYNKLTNKPSINGVELVGNKTTQDLHIETGGETWELINTADFTQEAVNNVCFKKDSNNNDFSLKKYRLVFQLQASASVTDGRITYFNTTDSSRYAVTGITFYNSYGSVYDSKTKAVVESVYQFDGQGTILFNACNGTAKFISMANNRWGNSRSNNYTQTAPFTIINIFWGTACTGKIELWGVKS